MCLLNFMALGLISAGADSARRVICDGRNLAEFRRTRPAVAAINGLANALRLNIERQRSPSSSDWIQWSANVGRDCDQRKQAKRTYKLRIWGSGVRISPSAPFKLQLPTSRHWRQLANRFSVERPAQSAPGQRFYVHYAPKATLTVQIIARRSVPV
jgi:hypothetical protein